MYATESRECFPFHRFISQPFSLYFNPHLPWMTASQAELTGTGVLDIGRGGHVNFPFVCWVQAYAFLVQALRNSSH